MKNESVLDKPQDTLDPNVWSVDTSGEVKMTDEAAAKVQKAVDWIQSKHQFPNLSVFIIGSITSNSYSDTSDIDIDFCSPNYVPKNEVSQFGWDMKKDFIENYMKKNPEDCQIGSHPFEVFFQPNPFQCMMSVGCYNFTEKKWEVGPEMKDKNFDPIAHFYKKGMKIVDDIVQKIRNVILSTYETALIAQKSDDVKFSEDLKKELLKKLSDASRVFKAMKAARSAYAKDPTSKEEALKMRANKKWHQTDAAFKLLDKFGYASILKRLCELNDTVEETGDIDFVVATSEVISAVRDNFSSNVSLTDSEKQFFTEVDSELNEDFASSAKLMVLAAALAIPGLIPQKALAKEMRDIPRQELKHNTKAMNDALHRAAIEKKQFGNLSFVNMTNLLATIAYNEAMIDYVKFNDPKCITAILNVISNRAGGDPAKFASVISARDQFYSARHVKGGYDNASYKMYDPRTEGVLSKKMSEAWKKANEQAVLLLKGQLPNVIGNRNMIANKGADNKNDWNAWGKDADLAIGRHTFGYRPEHDGYRQAKKSAKTYIVKAGDNLTKIAKLNKTTVDALVAKNGIKDPNKLQIGQKLRV